jgi:hypothetical protein
MVRLLRKLRSERGAIGILLLFCIWAVVLLLAMIFNTAEVATRKQQAQTAADAVAQGSATWLARTTNQANATNMLICENGSAEVIWRAVPDTSTSLHTALNREMQAAQNLSANNAARQALVNFPNSVTTFYSNAATALAAVNTALAAANVTPQVRQDLANQIRQANDVLNWMNNVWVNGGGNISPYQPPPPGGPGVGLRQLVNIWVNVNPAPDIQLIRSTIQQELAIVAQFDARTQPALQNSVLTDLQTKRAAIFTDYQQAILAQTPGSVEDQRAQLASFYNHNLTLADPANGAGPNQPAALQAPVMVPDTTVLPPYSHVDSLRNEYPVQALAELGAGAANPISIDQINVHVDNAILWHPGADIPLPANLLAQYPGLPQSVHIDGWDGPWHHGWGHVYCAPLELYFDGRVIRDRTGIDQDYMVPIDQLRVALGQNLHVPNTTPQLPASIQDIQPDPITGVHATLTLPVTISNAAATGNLWVAITEYNAAAWAYGSQLNSLQGLVWNYYGQFYRFARVPFAHQIWFSWIDRYRFEVLDALGESRQFLVLKSYALRPLPAWAVPGMQSSAAQYVYQTVYTRNLGLVTQALQNPIINAQRQQLINQFNQADGGAPIDPTTMGFLNFQAAQQAAPAISAFATAATRQGAALISTEVAAEWVRRPWPYEITPPDTDIGRHQGVLPVDRIGYFTLLAGAEGRQAPSIMFPSVFSAPRSGSMLIAYAQAEVFNANEFSPNWGGKERLDVVTNHLTGAVTGSPSCWRVCTIGGWSYQPRLSNADALWPALSKNFEFLSYFQQAGLNPSDQASLNAINLH